MMTSKPTPAEIAAAKDVTAASGGTRGDFGHVDGVDGMVTT